MDRNIPEEVENHEEQTSLSARRAWIEIVITAMTGQISVVALRKESVDRNYIIKITVTAPRVALRKESVDRNRLFFITFDLFRSRSPQGERG